MTIGRIRTQEKQSQNQKEICERREQQKSRQMQISVRKQVSLPFLAGIVGKERRSVVLIAGCCLLVLGPIRWLIYDDSNATTPKVSKLNRDKVFASTPFCNVNGTCGESPAVATPRTVYSSRSASQHRKWFLYHEELNQKVQEYTKSLDTTKARPLVLLGDSITEAWEGTSYGTSSDRAQGVKQVLQESFSNSNFSNQTKLPLVPLVLGISGDQTQHLLWRLQNGHLQHPALSRNPNAIFVVMIGTNNLGSGELPGPTSDGIIAVLQYLLDHTQGHVIYIPVLPRGDTKNIAALCPPRCNSQGKPFSSFLPAIVKVNDLVHQKMNTLHSFSRIWPALCGDSFMLESSVPNSNAKLNDKLFSDRLHPNVQGHWILANCIKETIGMHSN